MELVYLWIEDFGIIKDQEFHFSKKFDIEFDRDHRRLIISKPSNEPLNLFNEAFLNITAIIGKNGSGKSTLFSFIKTLFSNNFSYWDCQSIMVLKKSDEGILIIDNYTRGQYELSFENRVERLGYDVSKKQPGREITELTNSTYLITHSNAFSIYERERLGERFLDISFNRILDLRSIKSNKMLIERFENLLKEYEGKEKDQEYESHKNVLTNYTLPRYILYHYDLQAKVNFISKYKNEDWEFIPKVIEINFNQLFYFNNRNSFTKLGFGESLNLIEEILFKKQIVNFDRGDQIELFKDRVVLSLFLFYSLHNRYHFPGNENLKSKIDIIALLENSDEIVQEIKTFFADTVPTNGLDPLNKIKDFYSILENQFDTYKYIEQHNNTYRTYVSDQVSNTLNAIFDIWLDNDFIFAFGWHELSAGESALLSLFARIHSIAQAPFEGTIWLLIDEGDLYLHPEWQRTFFFEMQKYLPSFFKGKKIQLILTSHSPFLVSDLPKENIILLDKEEKTGLCKVITDERLNTTFGANIHELYTNSFFLNKGLVGEFAKQKIQDAIKYLKYDPLKLESEQNPKPFENWGKDEVANFIGIIGEPLIAERLQKLFDEKYKTKEDIEKRIAYLQDQLKNMQ